MSVQIIYSIEDEEYTMVKTLENVVSAYFGIGIEHKPKRNYIHIGAYDGLHGDSTIYLQNAGWRGVLVEANPRIIPNLIINRISPKTQIFDIACVGNPMVTEVDFIDYPEHGQHSGLSPYADKVKHDNGVDILKPVTYRVRAMTANSILRIAYDENVVIIDYAQIDVEGTEKDVLAGFDLDKWRVSLIAIENNDPRNADLDGVMVGLGYRVFEVIGHNTVYERVS